MKRISDEEIKKHKKEAERLSWTHKEHPRFEKEKYLLEAHLESCEAELVKLKKEWAREIEDRITFYEVPTKIREALKSKLLGGELNE